MTDEVVILTGFVAVVASQYKYKGGDFYYDPNDVPECTIQLDGDFNGETTYKVFGHLKHGQKYELVMRPVRSESEKSAVSKTIEEIQASPRKFNDEI